jgi:hypothetical protein
LRVRFPAALAAVLSLASCASVTHDERVAIRAHGPGVDQGVLVPFDANVCSITVRDPTGVVHDRSGDVALDMRRQVPDSPWRARNGYHLVIAMPPGHYELLGYETSDTFGEVALDHHVVAHRTKCSASKRTWHDAPHAFDVAAGALTLVDLKHGAPDFWSLMFLWSGADEPMHQELGVETWRAQINEASKATRAELLAKRRQVRDGYDVYPDCEGRVAVVHDSGMPSASHEVEDRQKLRIDVGNAVSRAKVHIYGGGFGRGCVLTSAPLVMLADAANLDAAVESLGCWMVKADLQLEVDLQIIGSVRNAGRDYSTTGSGSASAATPTGGAFADRTRDSR